MLNGFKNILLFLFLSLLTIGPGTALAWHDYDNYYGDWNYHGSGRDHPYSAYIDRYYYIGPADYAPIQPDYIDYVNGVPALQAQQNEFTVNVPNDHGGYNAVVIKRSGNGFVGPQGEYYRQFPKITQLKLMYGK